MPEEPSGQEILLGQIAAGLERQSQVNERIADLLEQDAARRNTAERREYWNRVTDGALAKAKAEGARPLRRLTVIGWINSIPGLAQKFDREVPEQYVRSVDTPNGYQATVACPCNERPTFGQGQVVACGCGRWYLGDIEAIRVYRPSEGSHADE